MGDSNHNHDKRLVLVGDSRIKAEHSPKHSFLHVYPYDVQQKYLTIEDEEFNHEFVEMTYAVADAYDAMNAALVGVVGGNILTERVSTTIVEQTASYIQTAYEFYLSEPPDSLTVLHNGEWIVVNEFQDIIDLVKEMADDFNKIQAYSSDYQQFAQSALPILERYIFDDGLTEKMQDTSVTVAILYADQENPSGSKFQSSQLMESLATTISPDAIVYSEYDDIPVCGDVCVLPIDATYDSFLQISDMYRELVNNEIFPPPQSSAHSIPDVLVLDLRSVEGEDSSSVLYKDMGMYNDFFESLWAEVPSDELPMVIMCVDEHFSDEDKYDYATLARSEDELQHTLRMVKIVKTIKNNAA